MHEQYLYQFEHAINYNHFTRKVEDTHYCPERRQSGDVASVQDQCVRRGRGHGQEADAFLHTTVMTSFGISRSDKVELEGKDIRTWTSPNSYVVSKNARKINRWKRELWDMINDNVVAEV